MSNTMSVEWHQQICELNASLVLIEVLSTESVLIFFPPKTSKKIELTKFPKPSHGEPCLHYQNGRVKTSVCNSLKSVPVYWDSLEKSLIHIPPLGGFPGPTPKKVRNHRT